jgi:hypothetical protein
MVRWPKSRLTQASISLAASIVGAVVAFHFENDSLLRQYVREAPHDGQDGLAALMGAVGAAVVTFCCIFLFSLIIQGVLTGEFSQPRE